MDSCEQCQQAAASKESSGRAMVNSGVLRQQQSSRMSAGEKQQAPRNMDGQEGGHGRVADNNCRELLDEQLARLVLVWMLD